MRQKIIPNTYTCQELIQTMSATLKRSYNQNGIALRTRFHIFPTFSLKVYELVKGHIYWVLTSLLYLQDVSIHLFLDAPATFGRCSGCHEDFSATVRDRLNPRIHYL